MRTLLAFLLALLKTGLALAALAAAAGLVGAVIGFSVGIGSRVFNIITQP